MYAKHKLQEILSVVSNLARKMVSWANAISKQELSAVEMRRKSSINMVRVLVLTLLFTLIPINVSIFGTVITNYKEAKATGITKLAQATNLIWQGTNAAFDAVPNADSYSIQLYCENVAVGAPVSTSGSFVWYDFYNAIDNNGGGHYTFTVIAKSSSSLYADSDPIKSEAYFKKYKLATPSNVKLSDHGVASWDMVENRSAYYIAIYKGDSMMRIIGLDNQVTSYNLFGDLRGYGIGDYKFTIQAIGDGVFYADSPVSSFSETRSITRVTKVNGAGITWDGKKIKWTATDASSYYVMLYKDAQAVMGGFVAVADVANGVDFSNKVVSPGAYTVRITALGDNCLVLDAVYTESNAYIIATPLNTPTNLAWSNNLATWTAVSNANSYDVQLYKDGNPVGGAVNVTTTKADFGSSLTSGTGGNYTFSVKAKASSAYYSTSAESEPSAAKHVATTLAKVTGVSLSESGVAGWDSVSNASSYLLTLYKDGVSNEVIPEDSSTLSVNLLSRMRSGKDGTYTITVQAIGDGTDYVNSVVSDLSDGRTVVTLTTPSTFSWNGTTATWGAVEHATKYYVKLYKENQSLGDKTTVKKNYIDGQTAIDYYGIGTYTFTVQAIGDSVLYLDSALGSDSSAIYINPDTLPTVTEGLVWNGNVAHWTAVSGAAATSYDVQLYKDAAEVNGALKNVLSANIAGGADFTTEIGASGAGVFTYKVTAKADGIYYVPSLPSAASNQKIVLGKVSNVALSNSGVATWTDVSNETGYVLELYKGGQLLGSEHQLSANTTTCNLLSDMRASGLGEYKVRVTAIISGADNVNGAPSEFSENRSIVRVSQVSTMTWQGKVVHWSKVGEASYRVQLYKELVAVSGAAITVDASHSAAGADFTDAIAEGGSGSYTVKITTLGDNLLLMDSQPSTASSEYISPVQLAKPTGVTLSGECLASWTTVTNAVSYKLMLSLGNTVVETIPVNALSYDLTSLIGQQGVGTYTITVQAIGDTDNVHFLNSAVSDASGSLTVSKLSTPTSLSWNGSKATWAAVNNATSYDIQLYKDSAEVNGAVKSILSANITGGADFTSEINTLGAGVFTFKVTAKTNKILFVSSERSAVSNNKIVLGKVGNVALSDSGAATWTDVSNETGYILELYKGGQLLGSGHQLSANTATYNLLSEMRTSGLGEYKVRVTAIVSGVNNVNGTPSDFSENRSIVRASQVSIMTWQGKVAHWSSVGEASYRVQLYKELVAVSNAAITVEANQAAAGADFTDAIAEGGSGSYTVKITTLGDDLLVMDSQPSTASPEYISPVQLAKPTGVTLSGECLASWTTVTNAVSYKLMLSLGNTVVETIPVNTLSYDLTSLIVQHGVGTYTITVQAIGDTDNVHFLNSAISDASGSLTVSKLSTPAGLSWSGSKATWTAVNNATSYDIQLYKDSTAVNGALKNVLSANVAGGADFATEIGASGAGVFTFKVTAKGDGIIYLPSTASVASGGKIVLAQVSNVALSVSGVATWTDVQNETGYLLQLYKGEEAVGNAVEVTASTVTYDYLSAMRTAGVGSYTVSVAAKGNVPNYSNGPVSSKSNAVSISKLAIASNLNWNEKATSFAAVTNAASYEIQLYKDGHALGLAKTLAAAQLSTGFDFSNEIANAGGGIYTYTVKAIGDGILNLDGDVSSASSEKIVAIKLGRVTGVELSNHGTATWSAISHATSYQVQLYKDHTLLTPATVTIGAGTTTSTDFLDTMREAGAGEYYVTVTAIGDGTYYSNSDASTDSTSQSIIKLAQAENLTWNNQIAHWEAVTGAACYVVQLYKDGDEQGFAITVTPANLNGGVNYHSTIAAEGAGKYSYSVTTVGNEILLLDSDSKNSPVNIVSPYPATATFDKYTASNQYKDIAVSLALSEDTLLSIKNAANELVNNTDYTLTGNTLTISKNYLAAQPTGTVTLSLTFEVAAEQSLVITINNTQPVPSTGNTVVPVTGTGKGEGKRTAAVITGDKDQAAVEVQIQRKTDASGSTTDSITLGQEEASKTIEQAVKNQSSMATINMKSDDKSKADSTEVDITKDLTQMFGQNEIGLNIAANEVSMVLPTETIAELEEDVKIIIKKLTSKDEIDASNGLMLSMSAGSTMIGSPVSIETNYAKKTMLTLPIDSAQIPTDKEQLEAFINSLAVLVQHSDGEVVLQKGTIEYDKDGRPVSITITVDKFSTFTVIHTNYTVKNTVVRAKQMPDKIWTLKFKEELEASTVNAETIYVLDAKGNRVEVTLQYSNNKLMIVPKKPYKTKQTFTLYVTSEVKYQSGKSLEEERKYQFTICSTSLYNTTISSYSKIEAKKVWNINLKKTINTKAFGKKNVVVVDSNGNAVKVKIAVKADYYVSVMPLKPYASGKTYYIIVKGVKFEDGSSMTRNLGIRFSLK